MPAAIVPATSSRPWLLVGTGRAEAGAPRRVAVFSSPDGIGVVAPGVGIRRPLGRRGRVAAADGSVVLGGSVDDEDGAHPAVWRLTDAALSPPDVAR